MCEIPIGATMGHSTCWALHMSREQHVHSELLDKTKLDVLHTLHVHPIHNQFWQFPLCNVYRLWQPDELHQLLLGLVKNLLHWQLKYLKARNVKDQVDNRFTSVPQYPGLQPFSKPFDSLISSSWQGQGIWGMIRTLSVNCAPLLNCSKDDGKTVVETDSDGIVIGAVRALCECSLLVSQQNHSDLSLTALKDPPKRYYQKKGAFQEQKMSKSAKAKVDEQLATESHKLRHQTIHKICAAMEVQLYRAEKVQHRTEANFRCAWIEPDKQQLNGQRLIGRGQSSDWSTKFIRWHRSKASFSINYSTIMSDNYYKQSGLRQPVPEAHWPKILLKWRLLRKKRLMGG